MSQTLMFDLDKSGEEQLANAIRHLPPGNMLILTGSGYGISATRGGARRFMLRVPPTVTERPNINFDAFKGAVTAAPELARIHREFTEENQPPEDQD